MLKDLYELTNPQKSIWYTEEVFKGTPIANITATIIIPQKVDFKLLEKAINILVERNDSFRLKFSLENNQPYQYVDSFSPSHLETINISSDEDLKNMAKKIAKTPFAIFDSFLYDFRLVKYPDNHGGFIVRLHHLISDAWSGVFGASEIIRIYTALINNKDTSNITYPSYLSYITSEKEYIESDKFNKDKIFWNSLFETVPEIARIPSKNTMLKSNLECHSIRKLFTISNPIIERINHFCKENKISIFNFFMATFSIYLGRISNLNEFVIGTPILNRSNVREKHTSGMFINSIPLKITQKDSMKFTELASSISSNLFNMLKHQKYSYLYILDDLRRRSHNLPSLYDVFISYQNVRSTAQDSEVPFDIHWHHNDFSSNSLDIHIFDMNDTGSFNIAYDYQTAKYDEIDIINIQNRILNMINQILENTDISIDTIEIITPEEKNTLLFDFNQTSLVYPNTKTIAELFEEQVEKTPNKIALVFGHQKLTYQELNEKANSLAYYLRNHGVSRNTLIGVMVNRSLEMMISMLAILKAGGAYIPIDPSYPKDRIEYMLSNSKAKMLLTQNHLKNLVDFQNSICVDLENVSLYSSPKDNLKNINLPEDLAYVIYTSGSTGLPKGVMLKQINIINFIYAMMNEFHFSDDEVVVSITTFSFDIFVLESLMPLLNGLKMVLASEQEQTDIKMFNDLCAQNKVTVFQTTPSRLQTMLIHDSDFNYLNTLKYILIGGEPFPADLLNTLKKLCSSTKIYNMYGPTETAVWSSLKDLSDSDSITIGKPIANTQMYILDKYQNPLPLGIPGELYISGDGVCKGYFQKDDLTQKMFMKNPFLPHTQMYKTGDLCKLLPSGEFQYLERIDNQIKIRGLRIELGEIESQIVAFGDIQKVCVVKQTINHRDYISAYFTANKKIDVSALKKHLANHLTAYMIPSYFTQLENFPYTPNGKINKKALPIPETNSDSQKEGKPARNNIDEKLIQLLSHLLNVSHLSIDDNFAELGGDSLAAINLCAQIKNEFNVQLFVKDILETPVIQELSDKIAKNLNQESSLEIKPTKKMSFYSASSAQKRMFLSSNIAGQNSILYNIPGGIILDKLPDISKLEKALNTLVQRHESLRTYFEVINDEIVQKIEPSLTVKIEYSENSIPHKNLESEFKKFVVAFDLSKAPLFRTKLLKLDNHKFALFVDMHHIISDGTSLSIFIDELCKLYNDQELEPLKISYKDFAVWEKEQLASGSFKEAEEFWMNQFKDDIPVLNLPTNYPRPVTHSFEGNKVQFSLDLDTTNKINNLSKSLGVTPYMLLLSIYYILLKKYTLQDDIIVGTPVVGRNIASLYHLIGMFVNSLPIRVQIDSKKTFNDFLLSVKDACLNSFKYQTYPFDELVSKLNIHRDDGRNPLFDTMFIYQNNGFRDIHFHGIHSKYYLPDTAISKFDLSLEAIPNEKGMDLSFEYSTKLFNHDFIQNMSIHYIQILTTILDNEKVKIADINMLPDDEKNKLLHEFNNTNCHFNNTQTIVQHFETQVKKTPKKIAIVCEKEKITYQELNEKANCLAHSLEDKGINKNDVIGIMQNRSITMIVSILAVLKAGGTYILIDNMLPNTRVKYMLSNSNSKLLLVDNDYSIDFDYQLNINNFDESKNNTNLKCKTNELDSFAIIYTSGSTGNPKGVLLSQRGLINLVYAFDKIMKIGSFSNHLGISSVSFDMFAVELYTSLLLGRTLYLLNDEEIKNPVQMSKIIIENKVEFLITTPTKIELLLSHQETAKCLKILKGFQLGGEVFSSSLYERLSKYTKAKIYNGYGPTEITACCSNKLITDKNNINIGTPIPNTQIYILDSDLNLTPINVPGELCVAGKGVSLGYINDKAKTSKSFVPVKFTDEILYRTGDIAKFLPNGEIEYIGRNDFQVKLNGLRIELSEIEKKLLAIKEIESCTVLCDKNKTFLKAFFTSNETLSVPAIRKKLLDSLPNYMVPKYIFQIESIPMTANGKVNRRILDEYKTTLTEENITYIEPQTDIQKLFCHLWEEILKTKVGLDNDLFELGADSLSAIRFKVEALNHNIDVPYADIFKFKTVRNLSESHTEENVTTPLESFDYEKINVLIKKNKKQLKYKVDICHNNNVLLFGSNGFVGMHVIDSFIKNDKGTIYCIMRDKNGKGAENRFLEVLHFYFGETLDKFVGNRIIVLKGDITKENFGLSNRNYKLITTNISTIINAAANVKHFGNFDKFKSINIDAITKAIDFCKKYSKRLIHLSTLSISGNMFLDGTISRDSLKNHKKVYFAENNLFINQSLDNVYTRSKFEAEKIILDHILDGLDAQILRLGNITSRASDGKFQINPESNAFTNRLKSFSLLRAIPKSLLKQEIEFTPVDKCSDAIIKVLQNKCNHISVLHLYNRNHSNVDKIVKSLNALGFEIKVMEDSKFADFVDKNLSKKSFKNNVSGIINDLSVDKKLSYKHNTAIKSDFSIDFLWQCKFKWNKINKDYMIKYLTYLQSIGYLTKEENYDLSS